MPARRVRCRSLVLVEEVRVLGTVRWGLAGARRNDLPALNESNSCHFNADLDWQPFGIVTPDLQRG
jgi:hypothetical protein